METLKFGASTSALYGSVSPSPHVPTMYLLKPRFQRVLRPFAKQLVALGITANEVTLAAAAMSMGAGTLLTFGSSSPGWFLLLPLGLFSRMALNALDGIMAREFGQQSRLGAYLNELTDVISDAFLFLPFAGVHGVGELWIAILIGLAGLCEMAGLIGATLGAGRRYEGPMGKSDRAIILGSFAIWIGLGLPVNSLIAHVTLAIVSVLILLSIYNRIRSGVREAPLPYPQNERN